MSEQEKLIMRSEDEANVTSLITTLKNSVSEYKNLAQPILERLFSLNKIPKPAPKNR